MAVKVDIVLDWSGDLGPLRLAGTVAALLPPRLFQRDIALVEGDVAPVADGDIDLATFALGPALMLPRLEILSRRKNDDLAPSGLAIGLRPRVDRDSLGGPERLGAGEVAVLAEQVGDDLTLIGGQVEQRRAGRNGRAAEQPCLQLRAGWAMGVLVVEQGPPLALLRLGRECEMAQGSRSAARRVGKECVTTLGSWCAPCSQIK